MANGDDYSGLYGQIKNIRRMQKARALQLATKVPARGMYRAAGYTPAQLEAFAPMPGKFLPSDAAAFNKDLLAAFNSLTEASAAPDASEEKRMIERVKFYKAALQEGVKILNKKAQLGTDVEKARLRAQVDRTKETIDSLDKAEGVKSGSGRSSKTEEEKGYDAALRAQKQIKEGDVLPEQVVVGQMAGLKSEEAIDSYKRNLDAAYGNVHGVDAPGTDLTNLTASGGVIDKQAEIARRQGLLSARGSGAGATSEEDQAYLDERFGGGGLKAREEELAFLQQEVESLNAASGGELNEHISQIAQSSTGGRTTDIMEASDMIVGKGMSQEEKEAFRAGVGTEKEKLLDMMLKPGAAGPIKQAKMALVQDPNFQKFKKDMGIQTDEFGLRALRGRYKQQRRSSVSQDRAQMKKLRYMGTQAEPVRTAAIEAMSDTVEEKPAPKSDSAKIASETLDKRDVTVKTESTGGSDGY